MQQHAYEQVGISFPRNILLKIDHDRGDISRSRYILRLIEHTTYTISSQTGPRVVEALEQSAKAIQSTVSEEDESQAD
ncbi:MAG TPA: hypothetical protein VFI73_12065 [Candidatus Nitrosopolaris sp.]|nr:hypothetical protein [Candidatus Nitrosopolaris sp.]